MYKRYIKRALDLTAGLGLLIVLSPVMLLTAAGCAIAFRGRVMFVQERMGRGYKKFNVFKFITMNDACDAAGNPLPDKERINGFGKLIRSLSFDEFPQLFNVIRGDMSLVGPRPFMERYVLDCTEQQLRRYEVRPGITGLAQVCGRNAISYEKRFRYDVWYVDHCSLGLDFRILFMTAQSMLGLGKRQSSVVYDPLIEEQYRHPA